MDELVTQEDQSKSSNSIELTQNEWKQLCILRPDAFAHHYFGHVLRLKSNDLHYLLYELIGSLSVLDKSIHIAVAAPRGNAKTMILSVILPIWCVILQQKKFIFLVSSTSRVAENNLESIKFELESNEKLREDFPEACGEGPTWRKEMIETNNGIRLSALGSGKQLRGHLLKGGIRPDLVLCHTKGTHITTPKGVTDVSDLKVNDIVYNHKWEEDKICAWKPHEWEGDYYKFKLWGHPEEVEATAGHKFLARKKLKQMKYTRTNERMWSNNDRNKYIAQIQYNKSDNINIRELQKGDVIGYPINNKVLSLSEIAQKEKWEIYYPGNIKQRDEKGKILISSGGSYRPVDINTTEKWLNTKEFWFLFGLYLADGTAGKNKVTIYCNTLEEKHIQKTVKYANKLGMKCYKGNYSQGCTNISINNTLFASICSKYKQNKNSWKVPSRNIEFLNPELQKELIKGYIAGDGYISEEQGIIITSVCLPLLEFMQRILLRQNIIASIRFMRKAGTSIIRGRTINTQDKYDLYFRYNASKLGYPQCELKGRYQTKTTRSFIEDGHVWRKIRDINSAFKKDTVYPFTVQNEHTYINQVFTSKNCDDLDSEMTTHTPEQREKHEDWFTKDLMGMKGAGQKMDVLNVGTVIHEKALLSKLLNPKLYPGWKKHRYKAVMSFSSCPLWVDWENIYKDYNREDPDSEARAFFLEHEEEMTEGTEVLWPEGESYYDLMEWKLKQGPRAFFCFTPETKIVMEDGYHKQIQDVVIGDKVVTNDGTIQNVSYVNTRETDSDIYKIKIAGTSDLVYPTEEHPFLVWPKVTYKGYSLNHEHISRILSGINTDRRKDEVKKRIINNELIWKYTKDLKVGDAVISSIPKIEIKEHRCDKDWWWLVGYYLAEGYINKNTIVFTANSDELLYLEEASLICKKYGYGNKHTIKIGDSNSDKVAKLTLTSRELVEELKLFGKYSHGKYLPKHIDYICKNCFTSLWEGYISGDGYNIRSYTGVNSASEKLLLGFQKNWLKFGSISYMYQMRKGNSKGQIRGREFNQGPLWSLQKVEGKRAQQVWIHDSYLYSRIQRIEKLSTIKPNIVHGITVDVNHTYCVPSAIVRNSEKQNQPLDPSLKLFDTAKLRYFEEEDYINNPNIEFYGSLDPASGEAKRRGDRAAIITIAKDRKTGIMYVVDTNIKHMQVSEYIDYIKQMHKRYNYKKFGVDSDALKLLKDYLNTHIPSLNIVLYDLRLKKTLRIQRLEPDVRNGRIRFRKTQLQLIEELEMYPQSEYDDGLDALEIAVKVSGSRGYRLLTY